MKQPIILVLFLIPILSFSCKKKQETDVDNSPELDVQIVLDGPSGFQVYFKDIAFFDDMNGRLIGSTSSNCYRTSDGGNTWIPDTLPKFTAYETSGVYSLWLKGDTGFMAVGTIDNFLHIIKTVDKGKTWVKKSNYMLNVPVDMEFSGQYGIGVGNFGYIYRTTDYGETWKETQVPGISQMIWNVCFPDAGHCYIQTASHVYLSTDQGATFTEIAETFQGGAMTSHGYNMQMVSALEGYDNNSHQIMHTTDGCKTWTVFYDQEKDYNAYLSEVNLMVTPQGGLAFQHISKKHFIKYKGNGQSIETYKIPDSGDVGANITNNLHRKYVYHNGYFYVFTMSGGNLGKYLFRVRF